MTILRDPTDGQPEAHRPEEQQTLTLLSALLNGVELSNKHQRIAQFLQSNPHSSAFAGAGEIASAVGVSAATVVRLAQRLGCTGWPDLQMRLRHEYLDSLMPSEILSARTTEPNHDVFQDALRGDLQNLHTCLATVDPNEVGRIAELIARSRETVIISSGSYSAAGLVLSHLAQIMGYRIRLESHSGPELLASLALLDKRDCVIGISFWRVARAVPLGLASAQRRGIPTVGIADSIVSPVMNGVDHKLVVPTDGVSFFQSVTASVSVIYGLLALLQQAGGEPTAAAIRRAESIYEDLGILHH